MVGCGVGRDVPVGRDVGKDDRVGWIEGEGVGTLVGVRLGSCEGDGIGTLLGAGDGSPVGAGTGSCVGRGFGVAAEGRGEKKKKAKKMAAIVDGVDRPKRR